MFSEDSSQTPAGASLLLTLRVPSFKSQKGARGEKKETLLPIVPSWNDVLQLQPWARQKRKGEILDAFLCALRASAADSSTRTTSARSTLSIAADMLDSYRATALAKRKLRSANARRSKAKKKQP